MIKQIDVVTVVAALEEYGWVEEAMEEAMEVCKKKSIGEVSTVVVAAVSIAFVETINVVAVDNKKHLLRSEETIVAMVVAIDRDNVYCFCSHGSFSLIGVFIYKFFFSSELNS